jgi:poly-gamma-glutamate synthesis protein (capsule biosynthesis protein)
MRVLPLVLALAGWGNTTPGPAPAGATPTAPVAPRAPAAPVPCDAAVPAAACAKRGGLRICKPDDPERVGEWRYALIGPSFGAVEDLDTDKLAAAWRGEGITLSASAETQAALTPALGNSKLTTLAPGTRPDIDNKHWAILPAHELIPYWKVITVGGKHPLDAALDPLAVPLCSSDKKLAVRNIDPAKVTTIGMTGVTAITRGMAKLMNEKGVLYPLPAVEPWLASVDYVHVSNEVSFVPKCDAGTDPMTMSFCSKESYMELLEKSHVKIVEMTGSHLSNYGEKWIPYTLDMYDKRGWMYFGGGRNQIEAATPRVIEHHGNKLVFFGCNMVRTTSKAISSGPDTAACDLDRMGWEIRDYKKRGYIPIVSIQHEEVYRHDPPDVVVRDLRELAESGPAFVLGSQAHTAHPWDMHYGAYVHYGPGNFYFDLGVPIMRDAAADKLYFHDGKLLTVGHLYTRCEEQGRPRLLGKTERAEFLRSLIDAYATMPKPKPWATPRVADDSRDRPDSIVVRSIVLPFTVRVPVKLDATKKYPLVIGGTDDNAYVVVPKKAKLPADKLVAFMVAKYPIDPAAVTLDGKPYVEPKPEPAKSKKTKR